MISGPFPCEILIIGDFADKKSFDVILRELTKLGIAGSCVTYFSLFPDSMPWSSYADGDPVDGHISARKTCPGPEWTSHNGYWLSPALTAAWDTANYNIQAAQPKLVIGLGKAPLALLTGNTEISKWRGSRLTPREFPFTFVPVQHPRILLKQPDQQWILNLDLKRAYNIYTHAQIPRNYSFTIQPSYQQVVDNLLGLLERADATKDLRLSGDIETRAGFISCFGLAWNETEALCIPFMIIQPPMPKTVEELNAYEIWQKKYPNSPWYWAVDEEAFIVSLLQQLFTHPNVIWLGQNYAYDAQYYYRHWGFLPARVWDTMVGHHALHSNIRKGLDFLSSLYAQDHVYWKDEINDWDPKIGERQYWEYNCKDCCITWEIAGEIQQAALGRSKDRAATEHLEFQQSLFFPVLRMMQRGVRINKSLRGTWNPITESGTGFKAELVLAHKERMKTLEYLVGHPLNPNSSAQLKKFFYDDLGIPGIQNIVTEKLTTNSPAMATIAERHPILKPLCQLIVELRSISAFLSTFIEATLDFDDRMRCSFSVAGPETYRFNSRENVFGTGANLQNVPVAAKEKIKSDNYIKLPNIRKLFIPDPGYTYFDIDLDRADLHPVVWEADDAILKKALRDGLDMHCMNACDIFNIRGIPYDELSESHPNYREHRGRIGEAYRQKAKLGVHATDYGVGDRKLATSLGITVQEAALFRSRWFGAHPGIRAWHVRTETAIARQGYIQNPFGARLYNFGRPNLPEFLGWLPQSTVAGVINRALAAIDTAEQRGESSIQLHIQVHDSLAGQFRTERKEEEVARLKELARIKIPYPDPLYIPVGVKTSEISWGDCK